MIFAFFLFKEKKEEDSSERESELSRDCHLNCCCSISVLSCGHIRLITINNPTVVLLALYHHQHTVNLNVCATGGYNGQCSSFFVCAFLLF